MIGPYFEATCPIGSLGSICNPNIALTFSKAPASRIFLAPPPPSSAGWKTRTTVPYLDNKMMNLLGIHERMKITEKDYSGKSSI
jgi:hypothetical protein